MTDLTEKWENKELKWHKSYYCKNKKGDITVATLMGDDVLYSKELGGTLNFGYWEVLAPCDYEELQALKEENARLKELLKECQNTYGIRFNAGRGYYDDLIKRIGDVVD